MQQNENCYGAMQDAFQVGGASWTSSDAGVATVDAAGLATAQNVGSTNIRASWETFRFIGGVGPCRRFSSNFVAEALCDVLATISIGRVEFTPKRTTPPDQGAQVVTGQQAGTLEVVVTAGPAAPTGLTFQVDVNQVNVSGNITVTISPPPPITITIGGNGEFGLAKGESKTFTFTFGHNSVASEVSLRATANIDGSPPQGVTFGGAVTSSNTLIVRP